MIDEFTEKCETCAYGIPTRDPNGEYTRCALQRNVSTCEANTPNPTCKLIAYTPNALDVIATAASVCYDSDPSKKTRLVDGCYKSGHHSVFEHITFTFYVEGVSRILLAQLSRHRFASLSVRSQRYCNEGDFNYVVPSTLPSNPSLAINYDYQIERIRDAYKAQVEMGTDQEDARYLLPGACETKFIVTMNFRELMHFCGLRMCRRAQKEIWMLAQLMKKEVHKVYPGLAKYLVPKCEQHAPYNFCTERESCGLHPKLSEVYVDA